MECLRYTLDILGQAYDDWRHALEQKREIRSKESKLAWNEYEDVLEFLNQQTWEIRFNRKK